jgi:polyisoprenoid-binding protein YceI
MTTWNIDTVHSTIGFVVRHMLVSRIRGRFDRWSGLLRFDEPRDPAASVAVEIDAASVDTNDAQRDAHLRSADFLDVQRFPRISFHSTRVEAAPAGGLILAGDLTIRDVTREVLLEVEYGGRMRDPDGNERAGFTAHTTINRRAFGVTFNQVLDSGGLALGDKLEIIIELEAIAQGIGRTGYARTTTGERQSG